MKAGMPYIVKKTFAIVLLGIIGLLTLNNALFMHLHRLPNGTLIVHAHPYSNTNQTDDSNQTHQHTKIEILVISNLLLLFSVGVLVLSTSFFQPKLIVRCYSYNLLGLNTLRNISNRAPPVHIF
jgi:hypothetical protein